MGMSLLFPKCLPAPPWLPPASVSLDSVLEDVHFAAGSDPHSGPHRPSGVPSLASCNLGVGLEQPFQTLTLPSGDTCQRPGMAAASQGAGCPSAPPGWRAAPATQRGPPRMSAALRTSTPVQRLTEPGPVGAVGACSQQAGARHGAPDSGLLAVGLSPPPGAGALRSPAGHPAAAPSDPSWWPPPPPAVPGQGGDHSGGCRGPCSGFMGAPIYWLHVLSFPFFSASFAFLV